MEEILRLMNPWWENRQFELGITRELYLLKIMELLKFKEIVIITGVRRVGKTTIIFQVIEHLIKEKKVNPNHILYVTLDHPHFIKTTVEEIIREFRKIHKLDRKEKIFVFLDEIQHINEWEKYLKIFYDIENVKIVVSGSSATLIKKQSPYITGRFIKIDVWPLDFNEFLVFKQAKISKTEEYKYEKYLDDYLKTGGLPFFVLHENIDYLSDMIESVVFKDIVQLYSIKYPKAVENLLLLMAARIGQKTSFNKLKNILALSLDTIKEYLYYLELSFIITPIKKFSYSINEQIYSAHKYYFLDNGIRNVLIGFKDFGSLAENALAIYLKRQFKEVFYYQNKKEIDFIIKSKGITIPLESKYGEEISNEEVKVILNFMKEKRLNIGYIISKNINKEIKERKKKIRIIPLWKLLIGKVNIF